jgi:site-specific DNA-methyltransferase (adenine-specific)
MNPPYGREIEKWVKKAATSEAITVGLLPARTDTRWYQTWVQPYASEVRFIAGRVKFGNSQQGAPFPSIVVIWNTPRTPRYGVIE